VCGAVRASAAVRADRDTLAAPGSTLTVSLAETRPEKYGGGGGSRYGGGGGYGGGGRRDGGGYGGGRCSARAGPDPKTVVCAVSLGGARSLLFVSVRTVVRLN